MNGREEDGREENPLPADIDPGESLSELAKIQQAPSSSFSATLRKKISRRLTAAHMVNFSWEMPKLLLTEVLEFVAFLFGAHKDRKGSRS